MVTSKPVRVINNVLYIEPISSCNLQCKMCYANVLNGRDRRLLDGDSILRFVRGFLARTTRPTSIYWSGTGEVFLHRDFPRMVNRLVQEFGNEVGQIIQTNGTVARLGELDALQRLDFQVSIDGLRQFHEWHRGENTYECTLAFCREAVRRKCRSLTVRSLLTRENIEYLDEFYAELRDRIGSDVALSLMIPFTNQSLRTARTHSLAIVQQDIDDDRAIFHDDARMILQRKYQGRYLLEEDSEVVDNYLSVNTYGVHSCCNGIIKLGNLDTDLGILIERLSRSQGMCRSCALFPCM